MFLIYLGREFLLADILVLRIVELVLAKNRVMCQIDPKTKTPLRIFKYPAGALFLPPEQIAEWPRRDAIESIRRQVFERDGHLCVKCGATLTWGTMHLHERTPRGKGGEIAVSNGWSLCYSCHILGEHGERAPQWSK